MAAISTENAAALTLWREVTLAGVRSDAADLTQRQLAVLLLVAASEAPLTVRGLAESLKVGKPAISRALDALGLLRLLHRRRDTLDKRNVLVTIEPEGSAYLARLAADISRFMPQDVSKIAVKPVAKAVSKPVKEVPVVITAIEDDSSQYSLF